MHSVIGASFRRPQDTREASAITTIPALTTPPAIPAPIVAFAANLPPIRDPVQAKRRAPFP